MLSEHWTLLSFATQRMSSAAHSDRGVWAQRGEQCIRLRNGGIFVDVVKTLLPGTSAYRASVRALVLAA
jgi:hypothetical protein